MWHKPCRTFNPWCLCIKTRCLFDLFCNAYIIFCSISLCFIYPYFSGALRPSSDYLVPVKWPWTIWVKSVGSKVLKDKKAWTIYQIFGIYCNRSKQEMTFWNACWTNITISICHTSRLSLPIQGNHTCNTKVIQHEIITFRIHKNCVICPLHNWHHITISDN